MHAISDLIQMSGHAHLLILRQPEKNQGLKCGLVVSILEALGFIP